MGYGLKSKKMGNGIGSPVVAFLKSPRGLDTIPVFIVLTAIHAVSGYCLRAEVSSDDDKAAVPCAIQSHPQA